MSSSPSNNNTLSENKPIVIALIQMNACNNKEKNFQNHQKIYKEIQKVFRFQKKK